MHLRRILVCISAVLFLGGCAVGPTPYQPLSATGGYKDIQLSQDVWQVKFSGNGFTTEQTTYEYALYRSAELTKEKGYEFFEVIDRTTENRNNTLKIQMKDKKDNPNTYQADFILRKHSP